jgi:hypothetical protein
MEPFYPIRVELPNDISRSNIAFQNELDEDLAQMEEANQEGVTDKVASDMFCYNVTRLAV